MQGSVDVLTSKVSEFECSMCWLLQIFTVKKSQKKEKRRKQTRELHTLGGREKKTRNNGKT